MRDFELSRFVVCTDAGLSSDANRRFNNYGERSFITTQSIKKLSAGLKEWCLDPAGWHLEDEKRSYNISELEDTPENRKKVFFKQKLIEGYDEERDISFEQTLIVTYSLKYKLYQQTVRDHQIERAKKYLEHPSESDRRSKTDAKRFVKKTPVTKDGEIAEKAVYDLNEAVIAEKSKYDGFYAVYTNLDDDPSEIAKINHDRWEVEESFRISDSWYMKQNLVSIVDEYENLDLIGNARSDSVIYDLAPAPSDHRGRPAMHERRLSIEDDFTLSDEKAGDYYTGVRRVLTNLFGTREVLAYVTSTARTGGTK